MPKKRKSLTFGNENSTMEQEVKMTEDYNWDSPATEEPQDATPVDVSAEDVAPAKVAEQTPAEPKVNKADVANKLEQLKTEIRSARRAGEDSGDLEAKFAELKSQLGGE